MSMGQIQDVAYPTPEVLELGGRRGNPMAYFIAEPAGLMGKLWDDHFQAIDQYRKPEAKRTANSFLEDVVNRYELPLQPDRRKGR